ncbi:uncharacterized protein [Montipora capricornis]|uniref:uncharacterized protein isoform X3 n=1 Tax=Montipora capricornis TaxID=246305 RepID=UPI0035F21BF9
MHGTTQVELPSIRRCQLYLTGNRYAAVPQNLHFIAGHRVGEVAHDYIPTLKQWLTSEGIKNSYDSWHGGKGVKKAIKKVSSGLQRDTEKSWFSELSDKVKGTETHIYTEC